MTMIDEEVLSRLFQEAADSMEVPADGADFIREAAAVLERPALWRRVLVKSDEADGADSAQASAAMGSVVVARRRVRVGRAVAAIAALGVAGTIALVSILGTTAVNNAELRHSATIGSTPSTTIAALQRGAQAKSSSSGSGAHSTSGGPTLAAAAGGGGSSAPTQSGSPTTGSSSAVLPSSVGQSAKIEETGAITLTVKRGGLQGALDALGNLAVGYGGFVADSQTQSAVANLSPATASVTLQIPVGSFNDVFKKVQALGADGPSNVHSTDVTGQVVDLQARIAAAQASKQQYLTILTKATTIGDIIAVQQQIDALQSDIEQMQGQLDVLDNETQYSTLSVALSEPAFPVKKQAPPHHKAAAPPSSGLSKAWHDSVSGFVSGVEWAIRGAGRVLFVFLLLLALFLVGRWAWRAGRRFAL